MKSTYIPIPSYKQAFEAVQYTGTNKSELLDLLGKDKTRLATLEGGGLIVQTSESGFQPIPTGQYLVKYVEGGIVIWDQNRMAAFMTAPIAVEAEFEKQKKIDTDKQERERVMRSGEALFR